MDASWFSPQHCLAHCVCNLAIAVGIDLTINIAVVGINMAWHHMAQERKIASMTACLFGFFPTLPRTLCLFWGQRACVGPNACVRVGKEDIVCRPDRAERKDGPGPLGTLHKRIDALKIN